MAKLQQNNLKDLQVILDSVLKDMMDGNMDNASALTYSKVIATKISGYKEQIKYKKLTGQPGVIEFFE